MRAQDSGEMASMTFDRLIFGEHPYARPDDGYPETIKTSPLLTWLTTTVAVLAARIDHAV